MAKCVSCGKSGVFLRVNEQGLCRECEVRGYQFEISRLHEMIPEEANELLRLQEQLSTVQTQKQTITDELTRLQAEIAKRNQEITSLNATISQRKNQLVILDDELLIQEFGLYQPRYSFLTAADYKKALMDIRQRQKELIRENRAVTGYTQWQVNGSLTAGRRMVTNMQKLLLRAFNSECDDIVEHVKYNNYEQSHKRLDTSAKSIAKLGESMGIVITQEYYNAKIDELHLALEYQQMKQAEKDAQKEIRAQAREEARLRKELEEARRKAEKEKAHYSNALEKVEQQIAQASGIERDALEEKKKEIGVQLDKIERSIQSIDYREANQRAGYVYVISNVGSFGENVYKIGMTRRLDPTERVDELGDASVPFNFDIHAMIFSEDAPALEAALHRAFEDRKLNLVNQRREFFQVTLDEIKEEVKKHYDKTAEFIDIADAEQYRISEKLRSSRANHL